MSRLEIRVPGEDEVERFGRALGAAFSEEFSTLELEHARHYVDLQRSLAAYDGAAMVGTTTSFAFSLSVPGGELPAAGVSAVGVAPTHRRRGILTSLMRSQLDDVHARGEPLAVLWASEGRIYGRFGYGLGTRNARIDADRDRVAFADRSPATGCVRLVEHDEALEVLPVIYDRVRAVTPGFHSRDRAWWEHEILPDEEPFRRGGGPLFRAVLELDGRPEAYALYRAKEDWSEGFARGELRVQEEVSASPLATREIWRFLLGIDLMARVTTRAMPPDHPLFLLAPEPPRLRFRLADGLWLRLVDVPAALAGRSYAAGGVLVLDLADPFCPWNEGRWRLDAGPAGASVKRTRTSAHLRLGVEALSAAYLGGFSFAELARAGLVEEAKQGAVAQADALIRTDRAPWAPSLF